MNFIAMFLLLFYQTIPFPGPGKRDTTGGGGGAPAIANGGAAHAICEYESANCTTSAINSTGATFLYACFTGEDGTSTFTDSNSNTWTALTVYTDAFLNIKPYYVANPSVGSGHTVTVTHGGGSGHIIFVAFTGVATTTPLVTQVANGDFAASVTPGSVTPGAADQLVVACMGAAVNSTATIDSGFTIIDQDAMAAARMTAMAWKVSPSTAAINPTWSWTGSNKCGGNNSIFSQ